MRALRQLADRIGQVEVFAELERAAAQTATMIASERRGSGAVFRIDTTALAPGDYVLHVVAVRTDDRVERRVPVEVVKARE